MVLRVQLTSTASLDVLVIVVPEGLDVKHGWHRKSATIEHRIAPYGRWFLKLDQLHSMVLRSLRPLAVRMRTRQSGGYCERYFSILQKLRHLNSRFQIKSSSLPCSQLQTQTSLRHRSNPPQLHFIPSCLTKSRRKQMAINALAQQKRFRPFSYHPSHQTLKRAPASSAPKTYVNCQKRHEQFSHTLTPSSLLSPA